MSKVRWEEMFPDELQRAVAACPVAWLSFGCLEAHGPHMAVGTDALNVHAICLRAAQRYGGVVAPPSYLHIGGHESGDERRWWVQSGCSSPWGLFLTPDLFYPLFIALLRQTELLGFKVAMAVSGHGGPDRDMAIIARRYMARSPLQVCPIAWWHTIPEEVSHGGHVETSHLWYFRPDLVDMSRLPADHAGIAPAAEDCYQASAEAAAPLVEAEVEALVARACQSLAAYRPWPGHQVMPRDEIIPFWHEIKRAEKDNLVEWA